MQGTQVVHEFVHTQLAQPDQVEHVPAVQPRAGLRGSVTGEGGDRVGIPGAGCHQRPQRPRRSPNIQVVGQQDAERLVVAGHRMVGARIEFGEHCVDQVGVVGDMHRDRIAGAVGDSGAGEVQLVVTNLLLRTRRAEQPVHDYRCLETLMVIPARRGRSGRCLLGNRRDTRSRMSAVGGQQLDQVARPRRRELLVGAVHIDTRGQPDRSQRLQALVEEPAGIAEQFVTAVAERQHGELQMVELVGAFGADRLPEQRGAVGELAVAERRGDHDEMARRLQVGDFDLVEFHRFRFDAHGFLDGLGERHGRVFGVTHVGAVAHDQ
ncbi:hypothetical protein MINTM005_21160 [Mycobacterium intracellulare]|nr:hypothetical protein MINTM005_21160 [Mycobacterium intracellulare]